LAGLQVNIYIGTSTKVTQITLSNTDNPLYKHYGLHQVAVRRITASHREEAQWSLSGAYQGRYMAHSSRTRTYTAFYFVWHVKWRKQIHNL